MILLCKKATEDNFIMPHQYPLSESTLREAHVLFCKLTQVNKAADGNMTRLRLADMLKNTEPNISRVLFSQVIKNEMLGIGNAPQGTVMANQARFNFACMLREGIGGDRDPITARELLNNVVWMSAAVEDKIQKKAIDVLANMLEIGDGGPIDESRARNLRARLKK